MKTVLSWRGSRKLFGWAIPFNKSDLLDRAAAVMRIGNLNSQEEIFEVLKANYPEDTEFVLLAMDMKFMKAGRVSQPFAQQLSELRDLKMKYPDLVFPFVAADPRRGNILDIVKQCIEEYKFQGIKIYPPLGYYPFNPGLDAVFAYAEAEGIPVMAHCSPGGVYSRELITAKMRIHPKTGKAMGGSWANDFTDNYTDPDNWVYVLEKYPKLKLCLAHFGGITEWRKYLKDLWMERETLGWPEGWWKSLTKPWLIQAEYQWHQERKRRWKHDPEGKYPYKSWLAKILDMLSYSEKYPNLYADISFTSYDPDVYPFIKMLVENPLYRDRILFGSDFYMVQSKTSERDFSIGLRGFLGDDNFKQIAHFNVLKYL